MFNIVLTFLKDHAGKLAAVVTVVAVLLLALLVYLQGYQSGRDKAMQQWGEERAQQLAQQQQETRRVLDTQADLINSGLALSLQSQEQLNHVQTDYERRMAGVAAGTSRVYIPVKPSDCHAGGPATSRIAGAPGNTARAELEPTVVANLASIARDGDAAIIERNELLARYEAAQAALAQLQQQREPPSEPKNEPKHSPP